MRLGNVRFVILIIFAYFTCTPLFATVSSAINNNLANFLVLADIHFDPFVSCKNVKPCPLIEKLRQANASEWPKLLAVYDDESPRYRQDTNYPLLISALSAAKRAANAQQAKFVLVLGDFLGHEYRTYYKKYSADKHMMG